MAITPVPDLTKPQNVGFDELSTVPVIHSVRWRHLPARKIFSDVKEVITYHQQGAEVIDIKKHNASYLDVYFLRSAGIVSATVTLRFVREVDSVLIEEPYTVGELGKTIVLENDPVNTSLRYLKGIVFTQKDLKNGTPMYDFLSMSNEGVYEIWVKTVDGVGNELHVRIPFQWANLVSTPGVPDPPDPEEDPNADHSPPLENVDEYYVTIVEGGSAFTKRPATHYRMAGIGMLKVPYCFERISTPPQEHIEFVTDEPVVGDTPPETCGLQAAPATLTQPVGGDVTFNLIHSNTSGVLEITAEFDATVVTHIEDSTFNIMVEGNHSAKLIVIYEDGQECEISVSIIGEGETPGVVKCGEKAEGSSGYGEFKHSVTETGLYHLDYDFYGALDKMEVFAGTTLIHATGEQVDKVGSPFSFDYKPSDGELKVVMNDGFSGSAWEYILYCPSNVPAHIKNTATKVN